MKKIFIISLFFVFVSQNFSQNITNTLATGGSFLVKDGSTTFLTLNQANGFLSLNNNLTLSHAVDSLHGVIYIGGTRFFHDYHSPLTDGNNIFIGNLAGNFTMGGFGGILGSYNIGIGTLTLMNNTSGYFNTAVGNYALKSNTSGTFNTAMGLTSLGANTTGYFNTAIGAYSLNSNTIGIGNSAAGVYSLYYNTEGGDNTAIGVYSMYKNTTGLQNTALGYESLYSNTSGYQNTAVGIDALYSNTTGTNNIALGSASLNSNTIGIQNSAVGDFSLTSNTSGGENSAFGYRTLTSNTTGFQNVTVGNYSLNSNTSGNSNTSVGFNSLTANTIGFQNTAVGHHALQLNTSGDYNTAVGYNAGSSVTTGANLTLIGIDANPSVGNALNEITLGNTYVAILRCQATTITSLSDMRDKKNIRDLDLGLDFIMTLRPRLYNWDKREWYKDGKPDGSKMQETPTAGFIAQELDTAQINANAEYLNLVLKSNPNRLEATPGNLLPIIVKAIQELKQENDSLKAQLKDENEIKMELTEIKSLKEELNRELELLKSNNRDAVFELTSYNNKESAK